MHLSFRRQRCYDHRLKELVRTSGDLSVALEQGIHVYPQGEPGAAISNSEAA